MTQDEKKKFVRADGPSYCKSRYFCDAEFGCSPRCARIIITVNKLGALLPLLIVFPFFSYSGGENRARGGAELTVAAVSVLVATIKLVPHCAVLCSRFIDRRLGRP